MRVLFVAPFGLCLKSTVRFRTLPLARQLAAAGHRVHLLIPPWDCPADGGRVWQEQGVTVEHVALTGGLPWTIARMGLAARRFGPDIVHIVKPRAHAGIVQWLIWQWRRLPFPTRGSRRPRLFLDVDDWEQAWAPVAGYPRGVAAFLAWQEEWGLRHADGITAASRWLEDRVHRYAPQIPVCYLPNGVEATGPPFPDGPLLGLSERPTILLFSRFVEVDGAWMAAFWGHLQERLPEVQMRVAGQALQPEQEAAFRRRLEAESRRPDGVTWLGYLSSSQLAALYREVHCAIFPAAPVPLNQAKCSVRLATTLFHGVPVVASAVGEQSAYGAAGAARLVPAETSPQEFARVVCEVLQAPEAARVQVQAAYPTLAAAYSWERLGGLLADWYAAQGKE